MLPMMRNRAMWKRPNPMVSTASSTVKVLGSEAGKHRERSGLCGQEMCVDYGSPQRMLGNQSLL